MQPIRLGLLSPQSGIVALYGEEITMAAKIAVDEINASGGLLGRELELVVEDDGSLPDSAVPAAFRLIDEHRCVAIIGNLLSNSRLSVSNLVSDVRRIPQLNFSFYEGGITSRYFFHFAALPNQQIDRMIPYMVKRFGPKMFFAGNNYEWPRGSIDAAKSALKEFGGEIVGEEYLPIGTTDDEIRTLIDKVSTSGADVFVPYFAGEDQINLLSAFTRQGLKEKMAVVMGHYDEAMVSLLKPEVREGFFSSNTYFMSIENEKNNQYKKRLLAEPGVDGIWPDGNGVLTNFGEGTYLCVHAFAQAVRQAESVEAEALIEALEQVQVQSPQGLVKMDKRTHHAHVNTYLSRCEKDGSFTIIESFGLNAPKVPRRYRSDTTVNSSMKMRDNVTASDALLVENMLDMVDVAILTTNYDGVVVDANTVVSEMFGYSHDELIGLSVHVLVPPHLRERHKKHLEKFVNSPLHSLRMGQRSEVTGYRKDGTYFSAEASISKGDAAGQKVLVATMIDTTKNRENAERLQWQATHDSLTLLANRKLITERLNNALERSKVNGNNVAVLFIDIDNFKLINDTFGHEAGDKLLIRVGKLLSKVAGPGDIIGRLGGDEFVIISEKFENTNMITALAERVNESLREPIVFQGQEVYTTASVGVVVGHGNTHFAEDMLRDSDAAMYLTKRHGRDNWNLFTDELHEYAKRELELSNGLRGAGDKGEFQIVFQPIVAAETGLIKGAEALLRWNSSQLGDVSPAEFVPVAEKNGTIIPIGKWVFEEVCKCMASIQQRYPQDPPYLSVNVSTVQIDEKLFDEFMCIAQRYAIDPHNIVLEITETSIMNDVHTSLDVLNRFAAKGFEVAVDDFGTGYSSLLQLMKLPITKIKIDKEFIDGVGKMGESQSIVSAIIKMSKTLGKEIIAEGVEHRHQLFELQNLRAEYIQGYYFHKPMGVDSLMQLLSGQDSGCREKLEGVHCLICVSRASEFFDYGDIPRILRDAKTMNAKRGITSFLIHYKNDFAQFMEGPEEMIQELLGKIKKDKRLESVEVIFECKGRQRIFNDFSMGFWRVRDAVCDEKRESFSLRELRDKPYYLYRLFEALSHPE